jgi:phosphinothricin acetyltransferase
MEQPLQVRPATMEDAESIAEIYGWYVANGTATFETEAPGPAEMARRLSDLLSRSFPWLVAERAGSLVGYAYAGSYRPRPAYRFTVENSIYLHHEFTGRGFGAQLLAPLLAECKSRGFRQMIAVIGDSANAGSIRLHEKFGFQHAGVLRDVGFKFERWLDTVLMQKSLG